MQSGRGMEKRDAVNDLKICEAATPGPWELQPEADDDEGLIIWRKVEEHPGRSEGVIVLNPDCYYEEADISFITESRTALPYWIKRASEAEDEANRLKNMINGIVGSLTAWAMHLEDTKLTESQYQELQRITKPLFQEETSI
ncbi:hypothetical protein [Brevibacillus sp. NRS-1366]|uniref:hypothetical protein n=1 Tax=Brevibacillus sp. NRS-1366 TaxID=3233899 RepID=UPI003D22B953